MPKKMQKGKKVIKKASPKAKVSKPMTAGSLKVSKPFNKSKVATAIADMTCVSKKDVNCVFDALFEIIAAHLKKRGGPGEFTLPNVAKFRVINKPATKAREGINPFTGEKMMFAAKPARNIVKIKALKKIKDIAK